MTYTPISIGDQSPLHCTFKTDSAIYALTVGTESLMQMHFLYLASQRLIIGTGTFRITNAPAGQADYNPSAQDVSLPGQYQFYPVLQLNTGPKAFDAQLLTIQNLP